MHSFAFPRIILQLWGRFWGNDDKFKATHEDELEFITMIWVHRVEFVLMRCYINLLLQIRKWIMLQNRPYFISSGMVSPLQFHLGSLLKQYFQALLLWGLGSKSQWKVPWFLNISMRFPYFDYDGIRAITFLQSDNNLGTHGKQKCLLELYGQHYRQLRYAGDMAVCITDLKKESTLSKIAFLILNPKKGIIWNRKI